MATPHRPSTLPRDVGDLLEQIAQYGTPFRIDGATATYYVLSMVVVVTRRGTRDARLIRPITARCMHTREAKQYGAEERPPPEK